MADAAKETQEFLQSLSEHMAILKDQFGKPLGQPTQAELAVLTEFLAEVTRQGAGDKGFRSFHEIPGGARKRVVALLMWFPVIEAVALAKGLEILYSAIDGNGEAGAKNDIRAFMILSTPITVLTWDELEKLGTRLNVARKAFVIGDLDWSGASGEPNREHFAPARRMANRLAADPEARVAFLHSAGAKTPADVAAIRRYVAGPGPSFFEKVGMVFKGEL